MLQIRTKADAKPRARRIVPVCLQARAPLDYEIRDEGDRLVALSLVGYNLTPGVKYRLIVTLAHDEASAFKLDFRTPKRIGESLDDESIPQGKSRSLTFEVNSQPMGFGRIHPILQLTELSTLSARIVFEDSRDPFDLEIPIVITRNVWLSILSLISPTIIGVGIELFTKQKVPELWDLAKLALVGILIWLVIFAIDSFRIWRKATAARKLFERHSDSLASRGLPPAGSPIAPASPTPG